MKRLLNIQNKLNCPKNQFNKFGNYSYRSCEDILEAVKPLLKEENVSLVITDEIVQIGDRYYVKATAILYDVTEGKEIAFSMAYAREEEIKKGMDGSQITGSSSSYARKYALNGLFLIDDVKDPDATNDGKNSEGMDLNKIDLEFAKKFQFNSGKHKGKTIEEILKDDKQYLNWFYKQEGFDEVAKKCIELISEEKKGSE